MLSARKFNAEMERHGEFYDRRATVGGFMTYYGVRLKGIIE